MTSMHPDGHTLRHNHAAGSDTGDTDRMSRIDPALWTQLAEATSPERFAQSWLTLQCSIIPGVSCGVVVLGGPEQEKFQPAGVWPDSDRNIPHALQAAAELAMTERRGVATGPQGTDAGGSPGGAHRHIGYPLLVDRQLCGVVAIEIEALPESRLLGVMRQLQWGLAWLEAMLRRGSRQLSLAPRDRLVTVLQLVATCVDHPRFQDAATAVVTELSSRLGCERASVGFLHGRHVRVHAMSHSADFGKQTNLIRAIGAAMDEALDQAQPVVYPADGDPGTQLDRAHAKLVDQHDTVYVCSVPFSDQGRLRGAFTLERAGGEKFDRNTLELCQHVAAVTGPILAAKRREDRWVPVKLWDSFRTQVTRLVGPNYVVRKLAVLTLLALAVFFFVATGDFRVTADASLEGAVQRVVVAALDGYIDEVHVRPGDIVTQGQLLATLDDTELQLEKVRWSSQQSQFVLQHRDAMAQHDRAESRIVKAKREQAEAQLALLTEQIKHTRITAPFDGLIVSGDLSQSLGAPVERGDILMEVAPLQEYRVVLAVEEGDIFNIKPGQHGELALASIPGTVLPFTVDKITPVSTAAEGRNTFRVEARLSEGLQELRPGMEGAGKVQIGQRRLIWIWSHKLINWLQLLAWRWWP
ncbi:MAG: efflux RND transporter periplasmic adaptor subunit [Gammaproteobacteria bacterium]